MYNFKSEQLIKLPIEKVFSFFERPENLSLITPNWLKFEVLTPEPLTMKSGAIFDYEIKILGFPTIWKTLIAEYDPPYKFTDIQAKGPYKKWIHTHTFEETPEGTLVKDNVEYELFGGLAGNLINGLYIKHSVKSIFRFRSRTINDILISSEAQGNFSTNFNPIIQTQ